MEKEKENLLVVNADDIDADEIDRKFEMLSAEGAKEMAKNYGAPDAFIKKGTKQE